MAHDNDDLNGVDTNDIADNGRSGDSPKQGDRAPRRRKRRNPLLGYRLRRMINPDKWSLRGRFVYVSGLLLALGVVVTYLFVSMAMHQFLDHGIQERLDSFQRLMAQATERTQDELLLSCAQAVSRPGVVQSLSRLDSEALRQIIIPAQERIRLETGDTPIPLQFFLNDAQPFFNTWSHKTKALNSGSDYGMVRASQRDLSMRTGLQLTSAGLLVSAVLPVVSEGALVGSVEADREYAQVFQSLDLPVEYGLVVVLDAKATEASHLPNTGPRTVAVNLGWTDLESLDQAMKAGRALPDKTDTHHIRALNLTDHSGNTLGSLVLFYDYSRAEAQMQGQLSLLLWLALGGAAFLWFLLVINVRRIKVFLDRMKRMIIASHSTDFAERFEGDSVHCLDVLSCPNKECPVWQDPSRVCYLETGDEAISPRWRGTCIFLNKYKTCRNCPVYRMRHGDELMEMRHVVNTMMRLWAHFLERIGRLLSEVLRTEHGHMPSLDEISGYLGQMAKLTAYGHDLQGVYDKAEVYRMLEYVFEEAFGLSRFLLLEVHHDENKLEVAIERCEVDAGHQEVFLDAELCRAKRMSEDVVSAKNPILCPYFDINTSSHVRCCLPMVMGGRVGAIFTFILSKAQWEARKQDLVVIKKYLDETAPVLSSLRLLQLSKEQALRDPLTHCHNRRFLDEYLSQFEYLSQRQSDKRMGFIMADLDHFKMVNDEFGHQAGDQVLQQVTQLIRGQIRRSDLLIRYGGEEFLILLVEPSEGGASEQVADKIRMAVEAADLVLPSGVRIKKTISLGVSEYPDDAEQLYKAIKFADVALYRAKDAGRNRVVRFTQDMWTEEDAY